MARNVVQKSFYASYTSTMKVHFNIINCRQATCIQFQLNLETKLYTELRNLSMK